MQPLHVNLAGWRKVGNIAAETQAQYDMTNKVRISNNSLNCYGTRILTEGVDLTQYQRNPVLLYMHQRGTVVGLVKNVRVEGEDIIGELEFDGATDLSVQLKKQWAFGSVKMVSAHLEVKEVSDDPTLMLEGQTVPTVTRSRLLEVSVVDIGGNDDALRLSYGGEDFRQHSNSIITLSKPNKNDMETKKIALAVGLSETASEAEVTSALDALRLKASETENLRTQVKQLQEAQQQMQLSLITEAVDQAVKDKRIVATKKDYFVELGKKVGIDSLREVFVSMQPQVSLGSQINLKDTPRGGGAPDSYALYKKLGEVPSTQMEDLHDNHHDEFLRLYKAEYGFEPSK